MPVWFGIPFLLGGLLAGAFGFALLQDEQRYGREGVSVVGVVVETIYESGGDDEPSYSIRYEFVDPATGNRHGGESSVSEQTYDSSSAGDPIEVTYLPIEPTKSRVGSPEPQLLLPVAAMGMGAIFAVVGSGLLVLMLAIRRDGVPAASVDVTPRMSIEVIDDPIAAFIPDDDPSPAANQPMSDAELRALDARLAAQPPSAPGPANRE